MNKDLTQQEIKVMMGKVNITELLLSSNNKELRKCIK